MERYFVNKGKGSLSIMGRIYSEGMEVPRALLEMLPRMSLDRLFDQELLIVVGEAEKALEPERIGFKAEKEGETPEPEFDKLSLEELNLLVKEKDPEMEPFETKEEAIAFLRMEDA